MITAFPKLQEDFCNFNYSTLITIGATAFGVAPFLHTFIFLPVLTITADMKSDSFIHTSKVSY